MVELDHVKSRDTHEANFCVVRNYLSGCFCSPKSNVHKIMLALVYHYSVNYEPVPLRSQKGRVTIKFESMPPDLVDILVVAIKML